MFFRSKSKLYRFDTENNEWKERGIGHVKFLQHKENKKIRLLMRQEKTLKIRANHIGEAAHEVMLLTAVVCLVMAMEGTFLLVHLWRAVMPGTKLQEHAGSDKAWVWSTVDFSEGQQKIELFCIRFGSVESELNFASPARCRGGGWEG